MIEIIEKCINSIFPNYKNKSELTIVVNDILVAMRIYFLNDSQSELLKSIKQNNYQDVKLLLVNIYYYIE